MDLDQCGAILRLAQGLRIDDEALAADAYREAGPGGDYLGSAHTMRNFETANYQSALADTSSFEQWTDAGGLTIEQRANARRKEMLADYQPPPLDEAIDEELQDFITRKKSETPDQWH